jgi:hypothetical protein
MTLEKVIQQLQQAKCVTREERENVAINIKICEMQIEVRNKDRRKEKYLKGKK